jgi:hypothetical protein
MNAVSLSSAEIAADDSFVSIRGVRLRFEELLDTSQLTTGDAVRLREQLLQATPFPHLVLKGLFNERLLELIHEEFDLLGDQPLVQLSTKYEDTRRSPVGLRMGPASRLYFWLANSSLLTDFLGALAAVENLQPDPTLWSGGLHETRNGGRFEIHRDFNAHIKTGLHNVMVFITYLNKDWQQSFNGALELWDHDTQQCVTKVWPEFGASLILPHGPRSYHGYTAPLNLPPDRTRRSVACYYYTNRGDLRNEASNAYSKFLFTAKQDVARDFVKQFVPPIVWSGIKKLQLARQRAKRAGGG